MENALLSMFGNWALFGNWTPQKVWGKRHNLKDSSVKRPILVHIKRKVNVQRRTGRRGWGGGGGLQPPPPNFWATQIFWAAR